MQIGQLMVHSFRQAGILLPLENVYWLGLNDKKSALASL